MYEIAENMEEAGERDKSIPEKPILIKEVKETVDSGASEAAPVSPVQKPVCIEYCEYSEEMKQQVEAFCANALSVGYKEQLALTLPENQKIRPEMLQEISKQFPHVSLQSRAGLLQLSRHPNMDALSEIVGSDLAPSILAFITTSKMDKESNSPHTFSIPAMEEKEKRRACHLFFRQKYPYVKTSTAGDAIVLTIYPSRKRARKESKNQSQQSQQSNHQSSEMDGLDATWCAKRVQSSSLPPLQFILKKTNFELMTLRIRLAELLHISQRSFGFAGIKDKKAVTYQFATVTNVQPEQLLQATQGLPGVEICGMRWVEQPLEVGQLWGNRFHLTLRNIPSTQVHLIPQAISEVCQQGFVNYFGTQRFGGENEFETVNAMVGLLLMRGDWSECVSYLLTPGKVFTVCENDEG